MISEAVLTALVAGAISHSVPVLLAALGESVSERSGILNLGIEGMMLFTGFVAFVAAVETGSLIMGFVVGPVLGAILGLAFGGLVVAGRADQVVLGLGVTLAGTGVSGFLFRERFGSTQPLLEQHVGRPFAGALDFLPVVGPGVADQRWPVYLAWILVPLVHVLLFRTSLGLRIRAAGLSPFGLFAVGGDVVWTRVLATSIAGACTGLAGSYLVIVLLGFFLPGVTGGVGFMAVAVAMLGRLSPRMIGAVSIVFGLLTGLDTGLQLAGVSLRPEFLQMMPYAASVLALIVWGRHVPLPRALGTVWRGPDSR